MRASTGVANVALSAARRADVALREGYAARGSPPPNTLDWDDYDALVEALAIGLGDGPPMHSFIYEHPVHLQDPDNGVGKPYAVRLAYSDSGGHGEPLVAIGGLTNVAQRFDFLALDAAPALRVIGLDLAGRGRSGWLAELSDYHLDSYVEQLRQLMDHLGLPSCTLLGSSLGGSTAIRFTVRYPERVRRIVLNDSSPYIPVERRARRARAVARHYVFRSPAEVFRRTGAAEKHTGPAPDAVLLHSAHHRTRWSDEETGRVYRHDLRALLAYREEARSSLDMWSDWSRVKCPVLLIHGLQSDATSNETIARMRDLDCLSVIHVPNTGHTPTLSDGLLIDEVVRWVCDDRPFDEDRMQPTSDWPMRVLYPDDRRSP
ncbi:MAG: alpha/beta hydrolase [Gammaproteobacteria bacterium]|nr:alpha/beta hydrolase [Gammaproteobacteria bacterium]